MLNTSLSILVTLLGLCTSLLDCIILPAMEQTSGQLNIFLLHCTYSPWCVYLQFTIKLQL